MFRALKAFLLVAAMGIAVPAFGASISPLICGSPGSGHASSADTSVHGNSCADFSYTFPVPQPATGLNNWQYGYYNGSSLNPTTFTLMTPTPAVDANGNPILGQNAGWWSKNFFQYWTALDAFGAHSNSDFTDYHQLPYCIPGVSCNPADPNAGGYDPRSPGGPDSGDFWAARRYIVPNYTGAAPIDLFLQKDPRTSAGNAQGFTEYVIQTSGGVAKIIGQISVPVNKDPNLPNLPPSPGGSIGQPVYELLLSNVSVKPGDTIDFVTASNFIANANGTGTAGYADFSSGSFQLIMIGIPEPGTFVFLAGGLLGLGLLKRRRAA